MISENLKHIRSYITHPWDIYKNYKMWKNAVPTYNNFIFVVGAPRSGTTLLQKIISAHPMVCSLKGETSVFSPKNLYDISRFEHLFSSEIVRKALSESNNIIQFFELIHDMDCDLNSEIILEKTPQHIKKISFILKNFMDSKVVNIYRDPRDCFISGQRAKNIPQATTLVNYLKYWNLCVNKRLSVSDNRIYDITYESLVTNPKESMQALMQFLNLSFEDDQLETANLSNDPRAKDLAFERLNKPISPDTVGRWRNELSNKDKELALKYSGSLLEELGYSRV